MPRVVELLRALFAWLGKHELGLVFSICVLAAGALSFIEIASEMGEGSTQSFDRMLVLALRSPSDPNDGIGPRWVEEMVRDVTALGGIGVLTILVAAVVGYLLLLRKPLSRSRRSSRRFSRTRSSRCFSGRALISSRISVVSAQRAFQVGTRCSRRRCT